MMSDIDLPAFMQRFPQELYDKMYSLVFIADHTRDIDASYRFPVQLHIDRASRKAFSDAYFGCGSSFIVADGCEINWAKATARVDWEKISSIGFKHRIMPQSGCNPTLAGIRKLCAVIKGLGYGFKFSMMHVLGSTLMVVLDRFPTGGEAKYDIVVGEEVVQITRRW